jgi:hypothetical protein
MSGAEYDPAIPVDLCALSASPLFVFVVIIIIIIIIFLSSLLFIKPSTETSSQLYSYTVEVFSWKGRRDRIYDAEVCCCSGYM